MESDFQSFQRFYFDIMIIIIHINNKHINIVSCDVQEYFKKMNSRHLRLVNMVTKFKIVGVRL